MHFEDYSKEIDKYFNIKAFKVTDRVNTLILVFVDITARKKAEEALRESESLLKAVLKSITEGTVVADSYGNLVGFNDAALRIHRYEDIDEWRRNLYEIPDTFELYDLDGRLLPVDEWPLSRALRGETFAGMEVKAYKKGIGYLGVWSYGGTRISDWNNGCLGIVTVEDITGRKRAEEILWEREERQAYLLKLSDALRPLSEAQAIQDTATQLLADHLRASQSNYTEYREDYSVVSRQSRNDASIDIVGSYRFSDLSATLDILRSGQDLAIPNVAIFPKFSEEERAIYLGLNIHANYSVPLIKEGKLVATLTVRQTTPREWTPTEVELIRETAERTWASVERARAEAELKKTLDNLEEKVAERTVQLSKERQRLFDVLETVPVNICLLTSDYHMVFANRAFRERFGESNGRPCYDYICDLDKPCEGCESFRVLETGQPHHWFFKGLEGSIIDVYDSPFTDVDGRLLVLEMNVDITEQRKVEAEMARLERLNLIGEMAASLGHEIRNPMTTVRGFLQMLRQKDCHTGDQPYFKLMIEEIDRANDIISEYLGMAKNKMINLKLQSIDQRIALLYPMIQSEANLRDMTVQLDLSNTPDIMLDENELRQLILNMCHNAMDAMPPHGAMTIGTRLECGEVILFIQDEGSGLPSKILDKMGTPFVTTKENGTGLGLAVCYSIAARHNARIDFQTGPSGTTFYVRFPLHNIKPAEMAG